MIHDLPNIIFLSEFEDISVWDCLRYFEYLVDLWKYAWKHTDKPKCKYNFYHMLLKEWI